jgi:competence protein ComEC
VRPSWLHYELVFRSSRALEGHGSLVTLVSAGVIATRLAPIVCTRISMSSLMVGSGVAVAIGLVCRRRRYIAHTLIIGVPIICVLMIVTMRSLEGLHPYRLGHVEQTATIDSDPQRDTSGAGVIVRLKVSGKHLRATAFGEAATELSHRSAGEVVSVVGSVRGWAREPPSWAIGRHLGGTISITKVRLVNHGSAPARFANLIRREMSSGAAAMPRDTRALFMGFVLGDNRDQPEEVADDFRASGLSHLLVVSGQNVAFVLIAIAPIVKRLGPRSRFLCSLCVLLLFGVLTRNEPSVLRAGTMAALTLWAKHRGRPQPAIRVLGLSVLLLVMIDPLLTRSIGFGLSVAATAGLAFLSVPIEQRLRGPKAITTPLAATIAAQVATFPILVGLGGVHPLSVLANLAALPAAEPVMVWGVVVGVPAGLLGPAAAKILHAPTRLLISWVAFVAKLSAELVKRSWVPLWWPVALGAAILGAQMIGVRWRLRARFASVTGWLMLMVVLHLVTPANCAGVDLNKSGLTLSRVNGRVVVFAKSRISASSALRELRAQRVDYIDVLIVRRPTGQAWKLLIPIRRRFDVGLIVTAGDSGSLEGTPLVGLADGDRVELLVDDRPMFSVTCDARTCLVAPQ